EAFTPPTDWEYTSNIQWKPTGEHLSLVSAPVAGPENSAMRFFSRAMSWTARATAELVRSAMAVTPSRSNHSRARAAPMSALFWLSADTREMSIPLHSLARQSSMASWAAATEPGPPMEAEVPDISVSTPILTLGAAACAEPKAARKQAAIT